MSTFSAESPTCDSRATALVVVGVGLVGVGLGDVLVGVGVGDVLVGVGVGDVLVGVGVGDVLVGVGLGDVLVDDGLVGGLVVALVAGTLVVGATVAGEELVADAGIRLVTGEEEPAREEEADGITLTALAGALDPVDEGVPPADDCPLWEEL